MEIECVAHVDVVSWVREHFFLNLHICQDKKNYVVHKSIFFVIKICRKIRLYLHICEDKKNKTKIIMFCNQDNKKLICLQRDYFVIFFYLEGYGDLRYKLFSWDCVTVNWLYEFCYETRKKVNADFQSFCKEILWDIV